jgi:CRISPR/Cas system endoribonuclease Cas6 (RAMP superfamily)
MVFELEMEASGRVIQLALDAGLGAMNGVGFGCAGMGK